MPLGSCIGTWNELLKNTKVELAAQRSALSSNKLPGIWFNASPHPSSILSPCHLSTSSVVRSVGIKASLLGSALCHWFLPSGFYLRRWGLSSAAGFYLPSLGSTPRRWALPSIIGFYPLSSGAAFRCWVIPLVSELCLLPLGCTLSLGPCCCGTCYASMVVHHCRSHCCRTLLMVWSIGAMCHGWALCPIVGQWVVDKRYAWQIGRVGGR